MLTLFDQEYVWNLERENIRSKAHAEGCSQGRNEERKEIIQNMLDENIRPDVIAEVVKIPVEQVVAIGKKQR
ncbi:MAG: hypothetical protein ACI3U2_04555 [Anaerovibrio sp.]